MSAMMSLAAHAERLARGSFELILEKELVKRFHPDSIVFLDKMAEKNIAKFEDGCYMLKGKIEEGKVVVNGIQYTLQQLIMLILM
jgi:hypothetical protein